MTKYAYLAELAECLEGLPEEEINKTIAYYNEIIEDRMEEGLTEDAAVGALEHPYEVARQLLVELLTRPSSREKPEREHLPQGSYTLKEQHFLAANVCEVKIQEENASIRLLGSPDEWIHLSYGESEMDGYEIQKEGERLSIFRRRQPKWKNSIQQSRRKQPVLTVALPTQFAGNLTAESYNGNISAQQIQLSGELQLKTSNGRLLLEQCTAHSLKGKTENGQISLKNVQTEQTLTATTSNDAIRAVDLRCGSSMKLQSANGKIVVEQVMAETEMILQTSNAAIIGSVAERADAFTIVSHTSNGSSNLPGKWGKGNKLLNVKTSNGSIQINFLDSDD